MPARAKARQLRIRTVNPTPFVPGNFNSSIPKNRTEQHRRRKRLPNMATTAATVTEADRFGE
jgi:hypothetical protein